MSLTIKKISGLTATLLIDSTSTTGVGSLHLSNIHSTDAVSVDLYLSDADGTYYIFKNVSMPTGSSLFLEGKEISFGRDFHSLYIKLSASDSAVDVLIRN
mgnify:FL=1|jgi:hypothetical protein|tara:strand:+ start:2589 stop:2888 length:300 start_codon:yes stop_codon:yes gene_type:complete